MLPDVEIDSPSYIAVWVADDPADSIDGVNLDGDPLVDSNGTLTLHAEAFGPTGTHKVIEVTVARTSGTEIERGQIAQRGQEELNQRSRKAAVQTPGKTLTNMRMNTSHGQPGGAVMANPTQNNRSRARRRGASRFAARRRLARCLRGADSDRHVVRRPRSWRSSIRCSSSSACPRRSSSSWTRRLRMLEDGSGTFYDPNFYKVSRRSGGDGRVSEHRYRDDEDLPADLQQPAVRVVAWQVLRRLDRAPSRRPGIRRIR